MKMNELKQGCLYGLLKPNKFYNHGDGDWLFDNDLGEVVCIRHSSTLMYVGKGNNPEEHIFLYKKNRLKVNVDISMFIEPL